MNKTYRKTYVYDTYCYRLNRSMTRRNVGKIVRIRRKNYKICLDFMLPKNFFGKNLKKENLRRMTYHYTKKDIEKS